MTDYTDEEKAAMMSAAESIMIARVYLRRAAGFMEKLSHHEGEARRPYQKVMWLLHEDGAGAMADTADEGGHMDFVIGVLTEAANS